VNPEEVGGTEAWFQWGSSPALGLETSKQSVATGNTLLPVEASVEGLHPNETYHYGLAGFDDNASAPEAPLTSETASFQTPSVAPRVIGVPRAPFVHSASVVMSAELNPENASTGYEFQYAPVGACEGREREVGHALPLAECPGMLETGSLESALYGQIGATLEATGLQPATSYRFRLAAENEHGEKAMGEEGAFTTAAAAVPRAVTGAASAIGTTSALISGTVDPDGASATYSFEVGVYAGASTQYGVVFSGSVAGASALVAEQLALTGLQAGTTYAYRIAISSPGYGEAKGAPVLLSTQGLPEALSSPVPLPLLAVPGISFPSPGVAGASTKGTKALTVAQKLARALQACRKEKSKKQRGACERQARKRYARSKQADKRKKG
jgi:hypothetical protein